MHLNNTKARLSVPQPSRDPYGTTPAVAATVWHRLPSGGQRNQDDSVEASKHLPDMFGQKNSAVIYIIGYTCGASGRMDTQSTQKTTN